MIRNVACVLIGGIATLMILRELGVDIGPVLAGAGIVGLAVGFGAQTLVRDIISGFFLILEDQVRVGDVAAINGQGGVVEAINLRTIVLRDVEGTVHAFPNGAITTLANRSKDFSFYVIDLGDRLPGGPRPRHRAAAEVGAELQAGRPVRPADPGAARGRRRGRLQRLGGHAEAADQDHAAQAVGGRARAAPADPEDVRASTASSIPFPAPANVASQLEARRARAVGPEGQ